MQLSSENSADGNSESMNSNERALIEAVQQQFSQLDALADQQEHELWLQSDTPILEFYILPEQHSA